jgi:hypothetical protein
MQRVQILVLFGPSNNRYRFYTEYVGNLLSRQKGFATSAYIDLTHTRYKYSAASKDGKVLSVTETGRDFGVRGGILSRVRVENSALRWIPS